MQRILYLPDFSITSLNKLLSVHWGQRARMKSGDREIIRHYAMAQGLLEGGRCEVKRRVDIRAVIPKGQRALDGDNAKKSLLDALVHEGLLKNDSPRWCLCSDPVWARSESVREVFVVLTDLV